MQVIEAMLKPLMRRVDALEEANRNTRLEAPSTFTASSWTHKMDPPPREESLEITPTPLHPPPTMTKTSSRATVTHPPLGPDPPSTTVAEKPEDGTVLLGELIHKLDQMDTGFRYMHGASNERLVALDEKLDRVISGLDQTRMSLTNLEERVEKLEESLLDKIMKIVLRVTQQQGEV